MSEQSPEAFAYEAGKDDGRGGHAENVGGFNEYTAQYYRQGFRDGRALLWGAIRALAQTTEGTAALATYVDREDEAARSR